jgi:hypothetical protein
VYSISTADIEQEWSNKLVNPCQDHIDWHGSRDGGIRIVSNLSCIAWLAANFRSWLVSLLLR